MYTQGQRNTPPPPPHPMPTPPLPTPHSMGRCGVGGGVFGLPGLYIRYNMYTYLRVCVYLILLLGCAAALAGALILIVGLGCAADLAGAPISGALIFV